MVLGKTRLVAKVSAKADCTPHSSQKRVPEKEPLIGFGASPRDVLEEQPAEHPLVELGGFHRYKIVYSGILNRDKTVVSY